MPNEKWLLVIRNLVNPGVEGVIDLITRIVTSSELQEHSGFQLLSLEACSPPRMDEARKNVAGNPTT